MIKVNTKHTVKLKVEIPRNVHVQHYDVNVGHANDATKRYVEICVFDAYDPILAEKLIRETVLSLHQALDNE
jgi:hypothetical protein